MSAVSSVTHANISIPTPPVKVPSSGSGNGTPTPVGQPIDSADISRAGARGYLQLGRIAHQVKSGKLTSDQAKTLISQEKALHDQIAADKASNGGKLTPADAQSIAKSLNHLSKQIHDEAHSTSPGVVGPPTPAPGSLVNVAG